jgi:hypothetical protein
MHSGEGTARWAQTCNRSKNRKQPLFQGSIHCIMATSERVKLLFCRSHFFLDSRPWVKSEHCLQQRFTFHFHSEPSRFDLYWRVEKNRFALERENIESTLLEPEVRTHTMYCIQLLMRSSTKYYSKGTIIADSREDAKGLIVITSGQV